MFLRGSKKLKVELGELENEHEDLVNFLESKLKSDITSSNSKISVDSKVSSSSELKRLVNKFVYRKHLNHKYWVALEGDTVKIKKFKHSEKKEKEEKGTAPSTIRHGW